MVDSASNLSSLMRIAFTTPSSGGGGGTDTTAPVVTNPLVTPSLNSAQLTFTSSEAGNTFYSVGLSSAADMTGTALVSGGTQTSASSGANTVSLTSLAASTGYRVQFVVRDAAGNISSVTRIAFTTLTPADTTAPSRTDDGEEGDEDPNSSQAGL